MAFAVFRGHDPAGTQFDISFKQHPKVQEGYKDDGWQQPRQINHIAMRATEPERVAEFYHEVFELKEGKNFYDEDTFCVTDGTVDLLIRRTSTFLLEHEAGHRSLWYAVESIENGKRDLENFAHAPGRRRRELARGFSAISRKRYRWCRSASMPSLIRMIARDLSVRASIVCPLRQFRKS